MSYVKDFLQSTIFKRFLWNVLSAFLGIVVVYLGGINWIYAPLVIAGINGVLKELNSK